MRQPQFLLAVSALVVPVALAAAAHAKPAPHKAQKQQEAAEPARHKIDQDDLKSIDTAQVSLKAAIEAAETKIGGKVVDITFDADPAKSKYDAVLVKDEAVVRATIDAASGAVEQQKPRKSSGDKEIVQEAKALQPDANSLPAMIASLEEQHGARTVEADVQLVGDFVIYDLQMAKDGRAERVAVEAKSGRPIANPRALGDN